LIRRRLGNSVSQLLQFLLPMIAAAGIASLGGAALAAPKNSASEKRWSFDVYLDDSRIGFHEFRLLEKAGGVRKVEATARFDVKFLFINAFRYRHEIVESWSGNCLTAVDASTNSNGKKTDVEGELTESGFVIRSGDDRKRLESCVMTFAYWNPAFLEEERLLNPQTGEFVEVDVEKLDERVVSIGGREIEATGYAIKARDLSVRVWYSRKDQRWVALESPTKGGRILRYELST
jgi:hypothetical protein